MRRKAITYGISVLVLALVAIQFLQPERHNPRIYPEMSFETVAKPSPEVVSIVDRACRDCHSHSTTWPWYSYVAPASWLVADDVKKGRIHLNFSEWSHLSAEMSKQKLEKACSEAREGSMPLWQYRLIHSSARLSQADIDALCKASTAVEAANSSY